MRNLGRASRVAAGILSSRLLGFLRQALVGSLFGVSRHADVLVMAFRGPNLLQNLLGEQTLSASFIPIYSRLVEAGRERDAARFAGAIFGLLLALAGALSLFGVLLAEPFVTLIAPGFLSDAAEVQAGTAAVDRYRLAVRAVRLIFPMTGFLALAAWTLGVLNSHRRFFLPYFSPVVWNLSIIAALLYFRPIGPLASVGVGPYDRLLIAVCGGALVGGALQLLVQLPATLKLLGEFRPSLSLHAPGVAEALHALPPLVASRGVVQLSGYLDLLLASLVSAGAVGSLGYAQTLYLLPISLFGMSVAATSLPELSRAAAPEHHEQFHRRLHGGLTQMLFLTVPTCIGYLVFGWIIVGAVYRRGEFGALDQWLVYLVLAGYSIGMLSASAARLLANAFYATGDTRTPARIAVERFTLSAAFGAAAMFWLDRFPVAETVGLDDLGRGLRLGAVGLALAAGVAAWYELLRLHGRLSTSFSGFRFPIGEALRYLAAALVALLPALAIWYLVAERPPLVCAPIVLAAYAAVYLTLTSWFGISRLNAWIGRSEG